MAEALKKEIMSTNENGYPHITSDPNICNGAPIIEGTRTTVRSIVQKRHHLKYSINYLLKQQPQLTEADVHAALLYYEDHKEEIDEDIRDNENYEKSKRYIEEVRKQIEIKT